MFNNAYFPSRSTCFSPIDVTFWNAVSTGLSDPINAAWPHRRCMLCFSTLFDAACWPFYAACLCAPFSLTCSVAYRRYGSCGHRSGTHFWPTLWVSLQSPHCSKTETVGTCLQRACSVPAASATSRYKTLEYGQQILGVPSDFVVYSMVFLACPVFFLHVLLCSFILLWQFLYFSL